MHVVYFGLLLHILLLIYIYENKVIENYYEKKKTDEKVYRKLL